MCAFMVLMRGGFLNVSALTRILASHRLQRPGGEVGLKRSWTGNQSLTWLRELGERFHNTNSSNARWVEEIACRVNVLISLASNSHDKKYGALALVPTGRSTMRRSKPVWSSLLLA